MKTFFVITDTKNSNDHTMYLYNGTTHADLTSHLDMAKTFETEEEAEEYIEEWEIEDWAGVQEEEYFFTLENTSLTKISSGYGHWIVKAQSEGFTHQIKTNNSQLIDDAFNSEEGDTSYYDSVEEAREAVIELLND
ncbi:hypothetical protein J0871_16965 [Salegentibacter sp. BDJ18]|uniref:hypothetical protein n=1 Tax=Salegentibacter sp. BDJ18 TaxID=2816376 RepID=UPI001AAEE71F|nr:hypothetical protein [Salegentibacter sp. BDJ18]MBO2546110.1 hypothetical protein [Salegentibacter sp. BDJ18]